MSSKEDDIGGSHRLFSSSSPLVGPESASGSETPTLDEWNDFLDADSPSVDIGVFGSDMLDEASQSSPVQHSQEEEEGIEEVEAEEEDNSGLDLSAAAAFNIMDNDLIDSISITTSPQASGLNNNSNNDKNDASQSDPQPSTSSTTTTTTGVAATTRSTRSIFGRSTLEKDLAPGSALGSSGNFRRKPLFEADPEDLPAFTHNSDHHGDSQRLVEEEEEGGQRRDEHEDGDEDADSATLLQCHEPIRGIE
ncbi:hypothetical protein BGZ73_003509 [Actinomortierella ambigua]|nr:hypothetical protein BGZ73_003509 [Actinomortierella ambigua]